jgi:hypothetical protein
VTRLSQNNITINDTKKRKTSTVKHSPACFQHHLSQNNITTNLTIDKPGGRLRKMACFSGALNSLLRSALKTEQQEIREKTNRCLANMHKRRINRQGNAMVKERTDSSSDWKGRV